MKDKIPLPPNKHTWHPSPLLGQIVLVTTLNEDGQSNISPKSWVSMMAFQPPLVALGCNANHWTARNILRGREDRGREFVINVPGVELAEQVWQMSALPHPRPIESTGLTPRPAQSVRPPLVEECKAHLECVLVQHLEYGAEVILIGEIVAGSVDRAAVERDDPYEYMKLIAFLENGIFGVIENAHQIETKKK